MLRIINSNKRKQSESSSDESSDFGTPPKKQKPNTQHSIDSPVDKKYSEDSETQVDQSQPKQSQFSQTEPFDTCFICKKSLKLLDSEARQHHVNKCLDKQATAQIELTEDRFQCYICGRDLTFYNETRKQQHINRCCDKAAKKENNKKTSKHKKKEKTKETDSHQTYVCFICQKNLSSLSSRSRIKHLKLCAKLYHIKPDEVKQMLEKLKEQQQQDTRQRRRQKKKQKVVKKVELSSSDDEENVFSEFKYDSSLTLDMNNVMTVEDWLSVIKLTQYLDAFLNNGYDTLEVCAEVFTV